MTQDTTLDAATRRRRNTRLAALALAVVALGGVSTAYWLLHGQHFVATDNAYTAAELAQITPAVGGTVAEVKVSDTQAVKKGDVLVVIDPTDARLALAFAEAELDRTVRRVQGYQATDRSLAEQVAAHAADEKRAAAQLAAARADFERAGIDLKRREALVGSGSVSGDELTRAQNAFAAARAALDAAQAAATQARAGTAAAVAARQANATLIVRTTTDTNPEVLAARARAEQARVDFERTVIRAPIDGVVAKRTVQAGQRVAAGVPLMSVVPVGQIYVDANFKERQLEKVRVGQPVELHADLYGKSVVYHGVVEGFSGGSGSAFSAIPAQNATGNWIKVVQRLPVRVKLDAAELAASPLRVGLSMTAEIDTRSN
ncbi:HlyD family efflux transporter periplasmic adaptor subunit [Rubrivivax gelatinosus]|uniref:Membrane fusion protein (Multidrug efflux system) n=1 Tax=Rubrivivax gelatinosus TaxID=28068 RepID=A0A4R2M9Y6_RUBGE|nr:HlyD family efflux transporter periplasmic adaptor subunit [Rubrivivax gelatinosus]MBK1688996.1 EmrA/EmrK family multidrug efflux transporter periplasmic adaptor subunit [Rubrivivax gelatinosus]TCP03031.1 membrane fusion protein (multidrug efflux system) [Rubrivivax gelatinosus]